MSLRSPRDTKETYSVGGVEPETQRSTLCRRVGKERTYSREISVCSAAVLSRRETEDRIGSDIELVKTHRRMCFFKEPVSCVYTKRSGRVKRDRKKEQAAHPIENGCHFLRGLEPSPHGRSATVERIPGGGSYGFQQPLSPLHCSSFSLDHRLRQPQAIL